MDDILKQLLQEEQELQFTKFNEDTAWKLGSQLVEQALQQRIFLSPLISRGEPSAFSCQFAWNIR